MPRDSGHPKAQMIKPDWQAPLAVQDPSPPAPVRPRFRPIPFGSITIDREPRYIVKGLIPRDGLVIVWGPPKCGKSFFVFDLVMHVALSWPYRDRKTVAGPVVYVAAEGATGFQARIEAFRQARMSEEAEPPPFYLIPDRPSLTDDHEEIARQINLTLGDTKPLVIVMDTLNRTMRGSESSDQDMSDYIRAADALRAEFGCTVIVVHHCGHDDRRPRGHTALMGAADAQIAVKRNGSTIVAEVEFMKEGPEGEKVAFTLDVIEVGQDRDGDAITSLVVEPADAPAPKAKGQRRLPASQAFALQMLHDAIDDCGETPPSNRHTPNGIKATRPSMWRSYCYEGGISIADTPKARQMAFKRASTELQARKLIMVWNDWVWPVQVSGEQGTEHTPL